MGLVVNMFPESRPCPFLPLNFIALWSSGHMSDSFNRVCLPSGAYEGG